MTLTRLTLYAALALAEHKVIMSLERQSQEEYVGMGWVGRRSEEENELVISRPEDPIGSSLTRRRDFAFAQSSLVVFLLSNPLICLFF